MANDTGIITVHQRACPTRIDTSARCRCHPSFRAMVYDKRAKKQIRQTFPTAASARAWRQDTQRGVRLREVSALQAPTLEEATDELLAGMRSGAIRSRNRRPYAASTIDRYEDGMLVHVLPALGENTRLDAIGFDDVQELIDTMAADKASASTIKNTIMPLRVIYRLHRRRLRVNPTRELDWPEGDARESNYVEIGRMQELVEALPLLDRAAWALMLFGGLRLGEMEALWWEDVDMQGRGRLTVRATYCKVSGERKLRTKTKAGQRSVTMSGPLLHVLREHRLATGQSSGPVVRGGESRGKMLRRARKAWEAAGLEPINPHAARHSFISAALAADVSLRRLQGAAGHSAISTTVDIYGHRYVGEADAVADAIDALISAPIAREN
jgi:integrase